MRNKKFEKNKHGENFNFALIVIFLSIIVSLVAFISEDKNKATGFATITASYDAAIKPVLRDFNNIDSLRSLSKGNYYIDDDGIVYWLDDDSRPAIAKVKYIRDIQKNRQIYIDNNGNIGYVIK